MSKKLILLFATCLLVTSCLFGCGDDTKPSDDNPTTTPKVESTTNEDVTTTEPTTDEPTTQEHTTEEPTTPEEPTTVSVDDYDFKGEKLTVDMEKKDFFYELIIENGTKLYLNDIYSGTTNKDNLYRGHACQTIAIAIWKEYNEEKIGEIEDKYWEAGTDVFKITLEQNAVIEYNEGHKWYFYYVGENDKGKAVFDIYEID